jgi:hypothetical protein
MVMNKPSTPWWASMKLHRQEPAPDTDYADMGTAFGLDASLRPEDAAPPPPEGEDAGPSVDRLNRRSVI